MAKPLKTIQHPVLPLVINEDGTQMWYNGNLLTIHTYEYKQRYNYPILRVNFANRTHTVEKLVCEAWNGLREEMWQVVKHKDKNPTNNHYTNLYWSRNGGARTARTKRCSSSKIKKEEIPDVVQRIASNEPMTNIAKSYNTSCMSISRIKKRFMQDRLLKLKDAVMQATTPHARQKAYANYLGYKSVADAINAHTKSKFIKTIDTISMTI